MAEVKISVIVPVYNAGKYLEEALESITKQTLSEIEIICVDDGSTDCSMEIMKRYASIDSRIKLLKQEEPSDNAALARNLGLKYARGEYVSFLDADDFFESNMLEECYRKAKEYDAQIVLCDAWSFDDREKRDDIKDNTYLRRTLMPSTNPFSPEDAGKNLFMICIGAAWMGIFHRGMVISKGIKFDSVKRNDDIGFVYSSFSVAKKIYVINERYIHYRINVYTSQSANKDKWPESPYKAHKLLKQKLESMNLYEKFKVPLANRFLSETLYNIRCTESLSTFLYSYQILRNAAIKEFEIDKLTESNITNIVWLEELEIIRQNPPELYFFIMRKKKKEQLVNTKKLPFGKKEKVVIYGAGAHGVKFFSNLLQDGYNIVAWVDCNYENLGFPIQSPERLIYIKFEWVIVAIENEIIYRQVKNYLLNLGIESKYILWLFGKEWRQVGI